MATTEPWASSPGRQGQRSGQLRTASGIPTVSFHSLQGHKNVTLGNRRVNQGDSTQTNNRPAGSVEECWTIQPTGVGGPVRSSSSAHRLPPFGVLCFWWLRHILPSPGKTSFHIGDGNGVDTTPKILTHMFFTLPKSRSANYNQRSALHIALPTGSKS